MAKMVTEFITFKLIQTPCCGHLLCWINPRYPSYCPECGTLIFNEVKECVVQIDEKAQLKLQGLNIIDTQKAINLLGNVKQSIKGD